MVILALLRNAFNHPTYANPPPISSALIREFGDYVEEMKHLECRKGSDHVSWSQLEKWAKEFKELFGGD